MGTKLSITDLYYIGKKEKAIEDWLESDEVYEIMNRMDNKDCYIVFKEMIEREIKKRKIKNVRRWLHRLHRLDWYEGGEEFSFLVYKYLTKNVD